MDKKIPILWKHDHTKPIGTIEAVDGVLKFKFSEDTWITRENLFEIFGGAGIRVMEMESVDGVVAIKSGEILEFSLSESSDRVRALEAAIRDVNENLISSEGIGILSMYNASATDPSPHLATLKSVLG